MSSSPPNPARTPSRTISAIAIGSGTARGPASFFAILTKRRLKRGVFKDVIDLQAAINRFVVDHNQQPKPFVWTADPDKIIAAAARGRQVLDSIH